MSSRRASVFLIRSHRFFSCIHSFVNLRVLCGERIFPRGSHQKKLDAKIHPNLAEAQRLLVEANNRVIEAQRDNRDDMRGHAERARQLMAQASRELKLAAEAANAARRR